MRVGLVWAAARLGNSVVAANPASMSRRDGCIVPPLAYSSPPRKRGTMATMRCFVDSRFRGNDEDGLEALPIQPQHIDAVILVGDVDEAAIVDEYVFAL